MITGNIIGRTINIKYNGSTGTSFAFDYDSKQYYITAKHVIENIKDGDCLEVLYNKVWNKHSIKLVGHSKNYDISVIVLDDCKIESEPIIGDSDNVVYSGDVYFLGFPYNISNLTHKKDDILPLPLVKKGIISGFKNDEPVKTFFIDGINNPGFSGGPIVYRFPNSVEVKICGVVSGFRYELQRVKSIDETTEMDIKVNTGIIIGYGIEEAINLIISNPVGRLR